MFCPICYNNSNFEIKEQAEEILVKNEKISINSEVTYCKNCGSKVWNETLDDNNLKKAYNTYKQNHNLLTSNQIKAIREKYQLTQVTFAKILGLGEKTIARYENGAIQDLAQNNLIVLIQNINNFEELYNKAKPRLNSEEIKQIEQFLEKMNVTVITKDGYTKPMQSTYFGGYTYGEKNRQYKFGIAIWKL